MVDPINTEKAKQDKLFYFVANVVPFRVSDNKCLILKRSETEKAHPGRWAVPGGKLEHGDLDPENPTALNGIIRDYDNAISELCKRETQEESGLDIEDDLTYLMSKAFVRPDGVPVVLVKFAAKVVENGKEVVVEEGAFTDYAWVNEIEAREYDCIDGIPEEIAQTIEILG